MNDEKITIWNERIHACQNSGLTVATWCREHQISVATYYYWRKRVSANDEMLSVKEPVFVELTNIRKATGRAVGRAGNRAEESTSSGRYVSRK